MKKIFLRDTQLKNKSSPQLSSFLLEVLQILRFNLLSFILLPKEILTKSFSKNPAHFLSEPWLKWVEKLGPVYGKTIQILLSRIYPDPYGLMNQFGFDRIFGDWPTMPFTAVKKILAHEFPDWKKNFDIEEKPLGSASIAQVHQAQDESGKIWAIKIVKPQSKKRIFETTDAILAFLKMMRLVAMTSKTKKVISELTDLCFLLREEVDLRNEAKNIEKISQHPKIKKQKTLRIPKVHPDFQSENILVIELFQGIRLDKVVQGEYKITSEQKTLLAKKLLSELLIQVFEVGLFHGDPHAGNLILLHDGSVGLFDWGLTGEFTPTERKYISEILRSLITFDFDRLIQAMTDMGHAYGSTVNQTKLKKELHQLAQQVLKNKKHKKSIQEIFDRAMNIAQSSGVTIPDGLLLMVKSLVTIEGLAKGIDPDITFAKIAAPVLIKAAQPKMFDWFKMFKQAAKLRKSM